MATNRERDGKVVQFVNGGSAISSGDVVVINLLVGVALVDIANGETGSVAITQVYRLPKVDAAVIAQGEAVHYDAIKRRRSVRGNGTTAFNIVVTFS